jgi:hypothetical protein
MTKSELSSRIYFGISAVRKHDAETIRRGKQHNKKYAVIPNLFRDRWRKKKDAETSSA